MRVAGHAYVLWCGLQRRSEVGVRWYTNLPRFWRQALVWTALSVVGVPPAFFIASGGELSAALFGLVIAPLGGFAVHVYAWRAAKRDREEWKREQRDR